MKKQKNKPLPVVKEFADYFIRRARRVLKMKVADYDSVHIEYWDDTGKVWVWFHSSARKGIVARVDFHINGKTDVVVDHRGRPPVRDNPGCD